MYILSYLDIKLKNDFFCFSEFYCCSKRIACKNAIINNFYGILKRVLCVIQITNAKKDRRNADNFSDT